MAKTNITVIISAYNEEDNIKECVLSARALTRDIIVIDTESVDKTASIATLLGTRVISFPYSRIVEPSRKFSIERARGPWVFLLDADERITHELVREIRQAILSDECSYYKIPRKNLFGRTKWLKHGGWWPDHVLRLINKKYFVDWPARIHAPPKIKGSQGRLNEPIIHFSEGNLSAMVRKTTVFEDVESGLLYKAQKYASVATFFRKFLGELFRRLILWRGFLDGPAGVIGSIYQAY
ncbi:MAG: glycosyltransferase family 2 protein, partial [Candidatus Paceibacterota bacterium]